MSSTQTIVKNSNLHDEEFMVMRTSIIGTKIVVYSAWRLDPTHFGTGGPVHRCGTIHHGGDRWWGRIGTGPDCSEFANLPVGEERTKTVQAAYNIEYDLAYRLILSVYPEVWEGKKDMGAIEITLQEVA